MKKALSFFIIILAIITPIIGVSVEQVINHPSLDQALSQINMTRSDMTFQFYKNKPDFYRLKIVDSLFDKPINTYSYTNALSQKIWSLSTEKINYSEVINHGYTQLDIQMQPIKTTNPVLLPKNILKKTKKLSKEHQMIIQSFYQSFVLIDSFYKLSFASLTESEKNEISSYFLKEDNEEDSGINYLDLKAWKKYTDSSNEKTKRIYKLIQKINFSYLATSSYLSTELIKDIESIISNASNQDFKKDKMTVETEFGDIVINPDDDIDLSNAALVLEYQGDTRYRQKKSKPIMILMDFAGNDIYNGEDHSQGGAFMGIQYFIDYQGNDTYYAENNCQGSSCIGSGLLIDYQGDDKYFSESLTQGAGKLGVGMLMDLKGNDYYECSLYGQGFGYAKGFGNLVDIQGNDSYIVKKTHVDWLRYDSHYESLSQGCGLGVRPWFSGGIGLLSDKEGNDLYVSDIYGQGTAYWYSIGGLVDGSGNDQYLSYQYSQGSGVHLAFGALIDYQGDDFYNSKGVSQGCGHDYAFGGLMDLNGDDNYVCYDLSQGGGNANAISLFIDANGDDGYIAKRSNTMGYSDLRRSYGYIGLFLDLNGTDVYGSPKGKDNTIWTGSTYGAGIDQNFPDLVTSQEIKKESAKPVYLAIPTDIDSLFLLASAQPQALAHLVQPARDKIISMAENAMPYLIGQLKTEQVREQLTITETIPKIGVKAIAFLVEAIKDSTVASFAISLIGMTKDSTAFDVLEPYLSKDNPNYFYALRSIGDISNPKSVPYFIEGLRDANISVRRESAIGLQKNPSEEALEDLINCLEDPYQEVRYSALAALEKINITDENYLQNKRDLSIGIKRKLLETLIEKKKS